MTNKELNVQVNKLVNPARCMTCNKSASWWITVGPNTNYISFYYCDDDLPQDFIEIAREDGSNKEH